LNRAACACRWIFSSGLWPLDRQEKSIGIVLSGMGSDGSLGLKAIKEKNGLVLVQDPGSAKFDGMPRSATEAVNADIVAPVEELPAKADRAPQVRSNNQNRSRPGRYKQKRP
jgi:chemotaxis response regulator CheB